MTCSRPVRVSRSASARASSMVAGSRSTPSSVSRMTSVGSSPLVSTWWTESSRSSGSMPSENVRQACGSRSTRRTRWPELGERRPEGGDRGRLGDAALLVGDRECGGHRGTSCRTGLPELRRHRCCGMLDCMSLPYSPSSPAPPPGSGSSSPASSPPGATTWCWSPATATGWSRSPTSCAPTYGVDGRGAARRPGRPGAAGPGRGAGGRPRPAGRPAGQQRRLRPQATLPRQRRRGRAGACSTCWSPPCCGSPTPRSGRWSSAATAGSSTSRAWRRSCRAAPTARPRRGSTASASGRTTSTATAASP